MPDSEKTVVVFRKYPDGEIIALFPFIQEARGYVLSFVHVGQHSSADYDAVIQSTVPATPREYADLHRELTEAYGYDLAVKSRVVKNRPPRTKHIHIVTDPDRKNLFFASRSDNKVFKYHDKHEHITPMIVIWYEESGFRQIWRDVELNRDYLRFPSGVKEWRPES
jgi:hypothetical protein